MAREEAPRQYVYFAQSCSGILVYVPPLGLVKTQSVASQLIEKGRRWNSDRVSEYIVFCWELIEIEVEKFKTQHIPKHLTTHEQKVKILI